MIGNSRDGSMTHNVFSRFLLRFVVPLNTSSLLPRQWDPRHLKTLAMEERPMHF